MTRDIRPAVDRAWANLPSRASCGGAAVEEFERAWASYCGVPEAVGVSNGTDALLLTLMALGIGAGDEVILPANTFIASAEAVVFAGATPVFADVSPDTLLLTPEQLEAAITPRTAAVIVVHLYGQMPDMDALSTLAGRAGIVLIEDAAQAHGASWRGRRAGSIGRAGCFSFYPAKNLGAFGDAGAVVTADADLADRIRSLRDHGRGQRSRYEHEQIGTNSRLDALQAVVLTAKLPSWMPGPRHAGRLPTGTVMPSATGRPAWLRRSLNRGAPTTSPSSGCQTAQRFSGNSRRRGSRPRSTTRSRATGRPRTGASQPAAAGRRGDRRRGPLAADIPSHG